MKTFYLILFYCSVLAALVPGHIALKALYIAGALVNAELYWSKPIPRLVWRRNDKRFLIKD